MPACASGQRGSAGAWPTVKSRIRLDLAHLVPGPLAGRALPKSSAALPAALME